MNRFVTLTMFAVVSWGLAVAPSLAQETPDVPAPGPLPAATQPPTVPTGWARWLNPSTAPFIPIPEIGVDPNGGTTLGVIPTWIHTDDNHAISRIIAPDVLYNPYFGWGMHARLYGYPSADEQYSIVAGIKERVEREFNVAYQSGRERQSRWSINANIVYDVDGTPRFYGIGNESPAINETNYTNQQEYVEAQIGLNLTHEWQIQYLTRYRVDDVRPGTLENIASIETRFADVLGIGTNEEFLNRMAIIYDTRDNLTVPSRGMEWVAYSGLSSRHGLINKSLDSEAGMDGRIFWPLGEATTLTSHTALRYLLSGHDVPFWALSSIGGAQSVLGGEQPLRGFGEGRFYDRNSFSTSLELRRRVASFDAVSTSVELQVTPFVDLGRVFARDGTFPISQLHQVYGVGFRGVARPFVVGYVDVGYGSEGVAVFTGLNYPF